VRFGGRTGCLRLLLANAAEDGFVLAHQQTAGRRHALQFAQVEADVVVHQVEQRTGQVADQHIMRSIADGLVEGDVGIRAFLSVVGLESCHQGAEALFQALQVGIGCPFGSPFCRLAFEHATEFQHVFAQIRVLAHHVLPRVGKTRLQRIGHIGTPTLAAGHHPLRGQFLDGFAQAGSGNAEVHRQFALRRQAVAGLQRAFEDATLQRGGNRIGNTWNLQLARHW